MDNKLKLFIYRKSELIRQNKTQLRHFLADQIGGGKKLKVIYNNREYVFDEAMDKNYYILYSKDEFECVAIIIDLENKIAEIHGIGNYTSCLDDINTNIGSTLLKITLKMIKKYKDKLDIKKILITDNSLKKCNYKNIELAPMLTLLTGDTWYGNIKYNCPRNKNHTDFCLYGNIKYGFKPADYTLIKYYENNKKIMNTFTLKDINLIKYLEMSKLDKKIIEKSKEFIEKHQSLLVKDYLSKFLKEYDKTCEYFCDFYEQLYIDLGLYNFHHRTFELVI
jgi:hypothetical protein